MTVTREGNVLYGKFGEGLKFEMTCETTNTCYNNYFGYAIAFVANESGKTNQAVIYQLLPENRMSIQPKIK